MNTDTADALLHLVEGLVKLGWPVLLGAAVWSILWRHGWPWQKRDRKAPE